MQFGQAVKSVVIDNYATFSGRAPRSEYWWFALFSLVASSVAALVDGALGSPPVADSGVGLLELFVTLGLLLPSLAVSVRRLHDRGHSGWWWLLVFTGIGILLLLYWMVMPAKPGAEGDHNRWGRNPLLVED